MAISTIFKNVVGGAMAAIMMMSPMPTAIAQNAATSNDNNYTSISEPVAVYRYGENIDKDIVERAARIATLAGVPTQAVAGYDKGNCVLLVVSGEDVGLYGTNDLDRTIGQAAYRALNNKVLRNSHKGDCGAILTATSPQTPDIIIRYGSNVKEDIDSWVRIIESNGVSAVAIADYPEPNCAAIVYNGEIRYSFTDESIGNGTLSAVANALAKGNRITRLTKSDCPNLNSGD